MESLINTALLGTEKRTLEDNHSDPELDACLQQIRAITTDREDAFLQSAALLYNYRQCGFQPVQKAGVRLEPAPPELLPYVAPAAAILLSNIIESESLSLVHFWLERCKNFSQLLEPEFIPAVLDLAAARPALRALIQACCGERGKWLQQFNPAWNWQTEGIAEIWETGTINERKLYLKMKRMQEPAAARRLLETAWPQENAGLRVELLAQLYNNAGPEDLPWLETLTADKSAKVRDAVLSLLKTIPQSSVLELYRSVLRQSIELHQSKGLLGLGARSELRLKLAGENPALFATGIQQVSSEANVSDEAYILSQLVASVPPSFWEEEFNLEIPLVIELFAKNKSFPALLSSLGKAAAKFRDLRWLREILNHDKSKLNEAALSLLPQEEAERYALRFFENDEQAAAIVYQARSFTQEWSLPFAKAILNYTARNVYLYNQKYYTEIAALLPVSLSDQLEHCAPKETNQRIMWSTQEELLCKLLALKKQTLTLIK
jgi:hypothetical protein